MIEKNVEFRKVLNYGKPNEEYVISKGKIMDNFSDSKVKDNKLITTEYYLIADDEGNLHQVRPFNVTRIIK